MDYLKFNRFIGGFTIYFKFQSNFFEHCCLFENLFWSKEEIDAMTCFVMNRLIVDQTVIQVNFKSFVIEENSFFFVY